MRVSVVGGLEHETTLWVRNFFCFVFFCQKHKEFHPVFWRIALARPWTRKSRASRSLFWRRCAPSVCRVSVWFHCTRATSRTSVNQVDVPSYGFFMYSDSYTELQLTYSETCKEKHVYNNVAPQIEPLLYCGAVWFPTVGITVIFIEVAVKNVSRHARDKHTLPCLCH